MHQQVEAEVETEVEAEVETEAESEADVGGDCGCQPNVTIFTLPYYNIIYKNKIKFLT